MSVTLQNKKKLSVGIAAVAAAAITLGAGTYAFFSASGGPVNSTASAAYLQIGQDTTKTFDVGPLTPSKTAPPITNELDLTNNGNVTANLSLKVDISDTEDGCKGDEAQFDTMGGPNCGAPDKGELSKFLQVKVTRTVGNGTPEVIYQPGPVSGLSTANLDTLNVPAGTTVKYEFAYTFPDGGEGDNAAQGDSTKITTTATLKS